MSANLKNSIVTTGLEKVSFHFNTKERQCQKKAQTTTQLYSFYMLANNAQNSPSYTSAVHEQRTSWCSSWILKMQRNQRSNCQHLLGHRKSKRITEKTSTSASLTTLKPLTVWITTNCEKFLSRWEYLTILPASCKICMQIKKQQLELNIEQQTGSKLEKEYLKAVYCHPAYLNYMQNTSCKILGWMKPNLESRLPREI